MTFIINLKRSKGLILKNCVDQLQKVFRARTSPEAIDLVSRLLEYTPSARISPLQACAHTFFDELREPTTKLPNGRDLPLLFNFTESELKIQVRLADL